MPVLTIQTKGHSKSEKTLIKSITLIGSNPLCDVRIVDPQIPNIAAQIHRSKAGYVISSTDLNFPIYLNGQVTASQTLNDKDTIQIGVTSIEFHENHVKALAPVGHNRELEAYSRLANFVERLSNETVVPKLLEMLIDEIVAITKAERAFLVLLEGDKPCVKVARNMMRETLDYAVNQMSDTIVNRVLATRSPCVVSNALGDHELSTSASVVNFKLTSVMCVPLLAQGQLYGVIYVGNNSVVNAFDDESLKILSVFAGQAALIVKNAILINKLNLEADDLRSRLQQARFGNIIGNCTGMQDLYHTLSKASDAKFPILFSGATGTGKELIARELHQRSERNQSPFIIVNCNAIAENLLESELFGHVRGAFAGALFTRGGKFQAAHKGTLFLDEICEIPLSLQARLLKAITDKTVTKLGDTREEQCDVWVMAATSKKLLSLVRAGSFREDLYYSLNTMPIDVPSLKDRGNDVILLANFFLQKQAKQSGKNIAGFCEQAQNALINYSWPGNVRELENVVFRAVMLTEKSHIGVNDLSIAAASDDTIIPLSEAVERFRHKYISNSLERNAGNRTRAAKELGIDPRTIFRHLEEQKRADAAAHHV